MLGGFVIALPFALDTVGGLDQLLSALPPHFSDVAFSSGPGSGWTLLFLTGPAFIVSPGLIQKSYGAASTTALRAGVALNALALMVFAFLPVLLGMVARVRSPTSAIPTWSFRRFCENSFPHGWVHSRWRRCSPPKSTHATRFCS